MLIARALAGEPDLLVLDEPTAGVDLPNQQALAERSASLKSRGSTIVLVAHELGPLAPLVGRTVVMRDGRVAYDGARWPTTRCTTPTRRRPPPTTRPSTTGRTGTTPHVALDLDGG